MIGVNKDDLPYESKIHYKMLKYIRMTRNMTQSQFGQVCRIHQSVLARLETGELDLSIHYETKVIDGIKALNIREEELEAIKTLLSIKENKGE